MRKHHGFTIVELLAVIVVISILSAVTVVAYTGVQKRATNTQVGTALKQWKTAFGMYKAQTGSYPATPPQAWGGVVTPAEPSRASARPLRNTAGYR